MQQVTDTLTGQQCAVKYIDRGWSKSFYKYVSREILNHASLSLCKHPHVVEFYEVSGLGAGWAHLQATFVPNPCADPLPFACARA